MDPLAPAVLTRTEGYPVAGTLGVVPVLRAAHALEAPVVPLKVLGAPAGLAAALAGEQVYVPGVDEGGHGGWERVRDGWPSLGGRGCRDLLQVDAAAPGIGACRDHPAACEVELGLQGFGLGGVAAATAAHLRALHHATALSV